MKILNVGAGPGRALPILYEGWEHVTLDVDASAHPDIVCDAKNLKSLPAEEYDVVYCSHALEHFYVHEVPVVLAGFVHVLKHGGYARVIVPNMEQLFKDLNGQDISDEYYVSPSGPITFHDVIYGWGVQVAGNNLHYAHHCGFTPKTLTLALLQHFSQTYVEVPLNANLVMLAYKA
jgi:SAM-dependent methyltransferase